MWIEKIFDHVEVLRLQKICYEKFQQFKNTNSWTFLFNQSIFFNRFLNLVFLLCIGKKSLTWVLSGLWLISSGKIPFWEKNLWFTYSGNWSNDLCDGFLLLVKYLYLENCLYEIGHFVGQFAQLVRHSTWLAKELNFVKALWCIKLWKVWKSFHDYYFSWHIQPDAY